MAKWNTLIPLGNFGFPSPFAPIDVWEFARRSLSQRIQTKGQSFDAEPPDGSACRPLAGPDERTLAGGNLTNPE